MAITSDDEPRQTDRAVVSVRIPNGTDDDLTTEAERRLSRADGVTDVIVDDLQDLEPGLSATTVTVSVAIETTRSIRPSVVDTFAEVMGVEVIEAPPP